MSEFYDDDLPGEPGDVAPSARAFARSLQDAPMFAGFDAASLQTVRLHVERMNATGARETLGYLPADASEAAIIAQGQWKPGTYYATPVSIDGNRQVHPEKVTRVSSDHPAVREHMALGTANGHHVSDPSTAALAMVSALMAPQLERLKALEERLEQKENALNLQHQALLEERSGATTMLTDRMATHQDSILSSLTSAHQTLQTEQISQSQQALMMMQQQNEMILARAASSHDQQMARQQAQAEADRIRVEAQVAMERMRIDEDKVRREAEARAAEIHRAAEWERREAREMREATEREERRERWYEQERERARQAEKDRQALSEAKEEARQASNPIEATTQLVGGLGTVLGLFGLEPKDAIANLIGGGAAAGWKDVIKEAIGTFGEVLKAGGPGMLEGEIDQAQIEEDPMVVVQMPDGSQRQMRRSEFDAYNAAVQAQQTQSQGAPQLPDYGGIVPPIDTRQAQPQHVGGLVPPMAPQQPQGAPLPPPPPVAPDAPPGMDAPTLRGMRQTIVRILGQLRATPPDQWTQIATPQLLAAGPAMGVYLRHATIRGALRTAGAEPQLVEAFVATVDASGLVPVDVPRG